MSSSQKAVSVLPTFPVFIRWRRINGKHHQAVNPHADLRVIMKIITSGLSLSQTPQYVHTLVFLFTLESKWSLKQNSVLLLGPPQKPQTCRMCPPSSGRTIWETGHCRSHFVVSLMTIVSEIQSPEQLMAQPGFWANGRRDAILMDFPIHQTTKISLHIWETVL